MRVLIVGNPDPVHLGAHLAAASRTVGVTSHLSDTRQAFDGPLWRRRVAWRLQGHRPLRLKEFGASVVEATRTWRPDCLIATGLAPIDSSSLNALGALGVLRLNYLTDDPWSPVHRAPWFMDALGNYDHVFTPRRGNLGDLTSMLGPRVSYLPFAYTPKQHFPDPPVTVEERERFASDIVFAGGADRDRVSTVEPLIDAGFDVALYGGYWDRYRATSAAARGFLGAAELRKAVGGARVCLCLVRRANRDGHAMRTFEVAAMGGCMLVEDTGEHREIFGPDGETVVYFRTAREAVEKTWQLLGRDDERQRLANAVLARVRAGNHTYGNRLQAMLAVAGLAG